MESPVSLVGQSVTPSTRNRTRIKFAHLHQALDVLEEVVELRVGGINISA